jgi:benzoyl-CoA reductase subunit C
MQTARNAMAQLSEIAEDPDRYVARWKETHEGKVIGLFPMNFPAEIAHAAGALPVVIQEKRGPITAGNNLLAEFYCGYTRSVADQAANGQLALYDGFMTGDHCIQLLGAVDIVREELPSIPLHFGMLIAALNDPWNQENVKTKILAYVAEMESFTGRAIGEADLERSIAAFNENRRLLRRIFEERRLGNATFTPGEMQALVKSSMIMDKQEHSALLQRVIQQRAGDRPRDDRIRLHLSGHFCHAPRLELLELIEDCGAIVVDDDLYHGARYISTDVSERMQPVAALAEWYLDRNVAVPCPTRVQHDVDWDRYLLRSIEESGAEGVIVLMAKFCEPHMLYYPELRKALDAHDIPHLLIETEHEGLPAETIRTRVETMLERVRRRKVSEPALA